MKKDNRIMANSLVDYSRGVESIHGLLAMLDDSDAQLGITNKRQDEYSSAEKYRQARKKEVLEYHENNPALYRANQSR